MAELTSVGPYIWLLAPLYSWRAASGAKLMDVKKNGWHTRVKKEKLDFSNDCDCIIGQECGSFSRDRQQVIGNTSGFRHSLSVVGNGFSCGWLTLLWRWFLDFLGKRADVPSSERLKLAWVHQIDKRLAAAPAA